MTRKLSFLLAAVSALACLVSFYYLSAVASRGGEGTPLYSVRRHDPYGTAALYDLLLERGYQTRTLERPRLAKDARGLLIQTLPLKKECGFLGFGCCAYNPYQVHTEALLDWVARGNTVVQFTREETGLMQAIGVKLSRLGDGASAAAVEEHQARGGFPKDLPGRLGEAKWTTHALEGLFHEPAKAAQLVVRSPATLKCSQARGWRALAHVGAATVAGQLSYGKGRVVIVSAPTPVLNGWINSAGNLAFVLALVGDGPAIVDEWSHGIGHSGTVIGLLRAYGLLPLIFQVVFVLALFTWSVRGQSCADVSDQVRGRSSSEQIKTLGHLYSQALDIDAVRARVREETLRRVAVALRVPTADIEKSRLKPEDAESVGRLMEVADALRTPMRGSRLDAAVARALTLSHQFIEEKAHDRRIA